MSAKTSHRRAAGITRDRTAAHVPLSTTELTQWEVTTFEGMTLTVYTLGHNAPEGYKRVKNA